jgi:DnaJ-domain-containing protein 1
MTSSPPLDARKAQSPDGAKAVAQGRLEDRPLPRLLHQLFGKHVTGCLEIVDDSGDESRVYLRDGAPVHVTRPNDIDRLDQVIIEAGLLPSHVLAQLPGELPAGRRLGELLIERGHITSAALADALKLQMRRKLQRLFFAQRGHFAVYLDPHTYGAGDEFREMRVDPRCLMYPGVRAAYDEARLRAELAPLRVHRFRLLPTLPASLLEAMGFRANDPTLQALGQRQHTMPDLPVPGSKAADSLAVVLALLYCDLLETVPVSAPISAAGPAAVPARAVATNPSGTYLKVSPVAARAVAGGSSGSFPAAAPAAVAGGPSGSLPAVPAPVAGGPSGHFVAVSAVAGGGSGSLPAVTATAAAPAAQPAPAAAAPASAGNTGGATAMLQRLDELVAKLGTLSHFELLGVPESAPGDEINAAYLRHMRQFHPDRLASLGLREHSEKAARLVAQMNEAQAVLLDPRRRAEYLASRAAPAPAVDSGRAIIAAEESFQKGEVLLRKGDHARALEAFAAAMKANPVEPAYRAYWAWTRFSSPDAPKDRLVRETLKHLEEAVHERNKFPLAHHWIGLLHKYLGNAGAAENAFRTALTQDRTLLEAERELRVLEMRKAKAPAPSSDRTTASAARKEGGLFNKILKR